MILSLLRLATTGQGARAAAGAAARLDGALDTLAHTAPAKKYLHWLNVSQGQNVRLITIDEVCYFQAAATVSGSVVARSCAGSAF